MGIFNFFKWFKDQFPQHIHRINNMSHPVDNLLIDMNGIFHTSAQKVFKYGNYKTKYKVKVNMHLELKFYEDVCKTIEEILINVNPKRRLIMCIDGTAPLAKQIQQSKRRYVSALEREDDDFTFDSNNISPGTKLMHHLTNYIEWFMRKEISENPYWQSLEVIFSTDKSPNEGEHKIMNYLRKHGKKNETFVLHGLDADLIMLALSTHYPNFYILRDNNTYDRECKYLLIDLKPIYKELLLMLKWKSNKTDSNLIPLFFFNDEWAINDFVFLCFMIGNDFLHHLPALEIIEGGIHVILNCYKEVGEEEGHIVQNKSGKYIFSVKALKLFCEKISEFEEIMLNKKLQHRTMYFPDELLTECSSFNEKTQKYEVKIEEYRAKYNEKYFKNENMNEICHDYLTGLQWILQYYTKGVPDWRWFYPYHYSPLASDLVKSFDTYKRKIFRINKPLLPFQQLLCIIPYKSRNLLPNALKSLVVEQKDISIDLSGKRYEYQGIVLLPFINLSEVMKKYKDNERFLDVKEQKRNICDYHYVYRYNATHKKTFYSFYGNIEDCRVMVNKIEM
jgi:5'-3' exoribonuclease 1